MGGSGGVPGYIMACIHQIYEKYSDGTHKVCIRLPEPEVHRPTPTMRVAYTGECQYFAMISLKEKQKQNRIGISLPVHLCRKSGIIGFKGSYDPRAESS